MGWQPLNWYDHYFMVCDTMQFVLDESVYHEIWGPHSDVAEDNSSGMWHSCH